MNEVCQDNSDKLYIFCGSFGDMGVSVTLRDLRTVGAQFHCALCVANRGTMELGPYRASAQELLLVLKLR